MNLPTNINSPQKNKPTLLMVLKEKGIVLTNVNGVKMRIFDILLHRKKGYHSLYSPKSKKLYRFKNLSSIGDIGMVFFEDKNTQYVLELPEKMRKNFVLYLKNKQEVEADIDGGFDCKSFTDFLNGWENKEKLNGEEIKLEDINKLAIGTTIMTYEKIEDKKYKGMHYSVIVGNGIILSKLGHTHNGGEIAITTIEELQKVYSFNNIAVITKK